MTHGECRRCVWYDGAPKDTEGVCRFKSPEIFVLEDKPNKPVKAMALWPTVKVTDWCSNQEPKAGAA